MSHAKDNLRNESAPATETKDEAAMSDDGSLSENEEPSSSTFNESNNPLLELAALRTTIAPLLGRTTPSVLDQLSEALEKYPDQAQWYLSRGMVNAKLEKLDQAIQDMTTAIELAEGSSENNETICIGYLNRARARSELGDVEGAVSDSKLALDHADSNLKTECQNALASSNQKLRKLKEIASAEPEIVQYGAGVVIEDITEEEVKINAKKAGIITAVRVAKGRQQADVGRDFRTQFNEKVKAFEEEARERQKREKKRNKKKKRNAQKALEKKAAEEAQAEIAAAAVVPVPVLPSAPPSLTQKNEEEKEESLKSYKVESFSDPLDPGVTIERIHIPITYVQSKNSSPLAATSSTENPNLINGSSTTAAIVHVEGLVSGLSVGAIDESKFDFLKRYNF